MCFTKLKLYLYTLKYTKFTQVYFQIIYRLRQKFSFKNKFDILVQPSVAINLSNEIICKSKLYNTLNFTFLNKIYSFNHSIDWNHNEFGKLWTYNLNYFDFLNQSTISKEEGLRLILDFCDFSDQIKDGYEPYPISLRAINWIKFISKHQIKDSKIDQQLFNDYYRLLNQLEYHILANHLIENAFTLLFGAYYFQNEKFHKKAESLLITQLNEQILKDGGHYELAPMYHKIILYRILDCYNLVSNNNWKSNSLSELLKSKATIMLGWIKAMQFRNGEIAYLNDSTRNIAPSPQSLFKYAESLNIKYQQLPLKECGYRKMETSTFEILFDIGQISPSYQPGHSHADSLQFILQANGKPIIVDTGISTYEKNDRRQLERSTSSHNTLTINGKNSSDVWSGFRVGKRAKVTVKEDTPNSIVAIHDGYKSMNLTCERMIQLNAEQIEISDNVQGHVENKKIEGHLHFHPDVYLELVENIIIVNKYIRFEFPKETEIVIQQYDYCKGFNQLLPASKIIYTVKNEIKFTITKI